MVVQLRETPSSCNLRIRSSPAPLLPIRIAIQN
jgi:hypothetical protein